MTTLARVTVAGMISAAFAATAGAAVIPVMPLPSNYFYNWGDVFHWNAGSSNNGHYYMPVPAAGLTYAQALAAAAATPIPSGVPSNYVPYLLTITSSDEATMVDTIFPGGIGSTWMAVQQISPGNWVYTAGPEIGQPVSNYLTPNWTVGFPVSTDSYAYLNCSNTEWVSADGFFTEGYVVEFSIPTPGALALMGLGGLVAARRRR